MHFWHEVSCVLEYFHYEQQNNNNIFGAIIMYTVHQIFIPSVEWKCVMLEQVVPNRIHVFMFRNIVKRNKKR